MFSQNLIMCPRSFLIDRQDQENASEQLESVSMTHVPSQVRRGWACGLAWNNEHFLRQGAAQDHREHKSIVRFPTVKIVLPGNKSCETVGLKGASSS